MLYYRYLPSGVSPCAHGGIYDGNSETCYLATKDNVKKTFSAAETECQQYGGHLVEMKGDTQQMTFLSDNVMSRLIDILLVLSYFLDKKDWG